MMVAMAAHSEEQAQSIYHVTLSLRNPAPYAVLADSGHRYFLHNPPHSKENGEPVQLSRTRFFRTLPRFRKTERTKKNRARRSDWEDFGRNDGVLIFRHKRGRFTNC